MSPPRLLALALLAPLLAVPACGRKGEPIRPSPAPLLEATPEAAPPPPPGPALPEPAPTTTPGGADIF